MLLDPLYFGAWHSLKALSCVRTVGGQLHGSASMLCRIEQSPLGSEWYMKGVPGRHAQDVYMCMKVGSNMHVLSRLMSNQMSCILTQNGQTEDVGQPLTQWGKISQTRIESSLLMERASSREFFFVVKSRLPFLINSCTSSLRCLAGLMLLLPR